MRGVSWFSSDLGPEPLHRVLTLEVWIRVKANRAQTPLGQDRSGCPETDQMLHLSWHRQLGTCLASRSASLPRVQAMHCRSELR